MATAAGSHGRDRVHRYNAQGTEGLKFRKSPVREPFLTEAQKTELPIW